MKDNRYFAVKSLIEADKLHSLQQVFTIIPLSVVKQDMHANYSTFRKRVYNSDTLTLKDFRLMSELFEVPAADILELALFDQKAGLQEAKKKIRKK